MTSVPPCPDPPHPTPTLVASSQPCYPTPTARRPGGRASGRSGSPGREVADMPMVALTGRNSSRAAADMLAHPRDREARATPIVESAGGRRVSCHVTTGPTDLP